MTLAIRTIDPASFKPLSPTAAKRLTKEIQTDVADLEYKVISAYYGRAWTALGYPSWDEYVQGEFKTAPLAMPREDRRVQVASLRQQGLSLRAIASVTGVSEATVRREGASNVATVTGMDGKAYPAARPQVSRAKTTPPEVRGTCPTCGQTLPGKEG